MTDPTQVGDFTVARRRPWFATVVLALVTFVLSGGAVVGGNWAIRAAELAGVDTDATSTTAPLSDSDAFDGVCLGRGDDRFASYDPAAPTHPYVVRRYLAGVEPDDVVDVDWKQRTNVWANTTMVFCVGETGRTSVGTCEVRGLGFDFNEAERGRVERFDVDYHLSVRAARTGVEIGGDSWRVPARPCSELDTYTAGHLDLFWLDNQPRQFRLEVSPELPVVIAWSDDELERRMAIFAPGL